MLAHSQNEQENFGLLKLGLRVLQVKKYPMQSSGENKTLSRRKPALRAYASLGRNDGNT
jgi:hypothetical protein